MQTWHDLTWPAADYSRVPYGVFTDPEIYEEEQAKIFRGPSWTLVALEAEVPEPGDYKSSFVGDTAVVVCRAEDGALHGFVNRCAHRGTLLVREQCGNAKDFTCIYHHWCYNLQGGLIGVPFLRGLHGKGGMPTDFKMAEHGLRKLRVETYLGAIFATFDENTENLADYFGPKALKFLDRIFGRPIEVLGHMRQVIPANWKLYIENLKDPNHAGLLHQVPTTFGLWRNTQSGESIMDSRKRHEIHTGYLDTDTVEEAAQGYEGVSAFNSEFRLRDTSIVDYRQEWDDNVSSTFLSLFPCTVFQQFSNTLATRQVRPRAADSFELYWTVFGYADDDAEIPRDAAEAEQSHRPGGRCLHGGRRGRAPRPNGRPARARCALGDRNRRQGPDRGPEHRDYRGRGARLLEELLRADGGSCGGRRRSCRVEAVRPKAPYERCFSVLMKCQGMSQRSAKPTSRNRVTAISAR